jgi:hypothetical protein
VTDRALQFGHNFFFSRRLLLRTVILRDVGVVARGSVGCGVVARGSVGCGVVARGSVGCGVVLDRFSVVAPGSLGVVD